jgi:hypothetical protein
LDEETRSGALVVKYRKAIDFCCVGKGDYQRIGQTILIPACLGGGECIDKPAGNDKLNIKIKSGGQQKMM